MKILLFKIAGYSAVGLAFAGVFLPLLPTTPFLLLAAFCFSRSSPRMREWLFSNRWFGQYLCDYESGAGIPRAVKVSTIIILWSSILFTAIVFVHPLWIKAGLLLIALLVSVHIARTKTCKREN